MRRLWLRFANLFRGGSAERELSREIAAHLALLREDFERRGMAPEEAELAARRAFRNHGGGIEQAKELHRETRSFVWIEQCFKDLGYGWSNLRRNPGFTLTAVIALALGIGVNAAIFSIYNAVALKPLPVADPSRVVRIERWFTQKSGDFHFAYTEYEYLRDHAGGFAAVVAARSQLAAQMEITGGGTERGNGYAVSANYFSDLGVRPVIGRGFLPDEDRVPGASPVVVLDYRFWEREYRGDRNALGQSIKLNRSAYTIIGVTPREFTGTEAFPLETDFFVPLSMLDQLDRTFGPGSDEVSKDGGWREQWRDPATHGGFELLARLKPEISRQQAQIEADALMRRYLAGQKETDRTRAVTLQKTAYFGNTDDVTFRAAAAGVLLVVSLVLVVACANVANMLLARGVTRQREIAVRLALGASRMRVIRQLLTESILLSLLGGAAGVLLSAGAGRLLWLSLNTVFRGFHMAMIDLDLSPDIRVLSYAVGLSLVTGALFGLVPAVQATRLGLSDSMKQDGWVSVSPLGRSRLRGLLVGTQVAVSVALLVVGCASAGALVSLRSSDLGFETRDTYTLLLSGQKEKNQALRERLQTLRELSSVATGHFPLNGTHTLKITAGKLKAEAVATDVSDGYFETLGVRLLRGRSFTREEAKQEAHVAVISESTAGHLWPREDPLGKHLGLDLKDQDKFTDFEVIGVAKDARFANISQIDELHVYRPSMESPGMGGLVFRIRGDHGRALAAVRSVIQSFDPSMALSLDMVMVSLEDGFVALQRGLARLTAFLASAIAIASLAMAGLGIYGVMAFLVSQRTREIGIRVTLGATSRLVIKSILVQGLRPVLVGLAIGFAMGVAANVVERASDPFPDSLARSVFGEWPLYGGLAVMLTIAALASIIPARRALWVDPAVALRHE